MARFYHTADLHLDSPFKGLSHLPQDLLDQFTSASQKSFSRLVEEAIEEQIDFLLVVGDIFDAQTQSIQAQVFFKRQMERLDSQQIPVYLTLGNHDTLKFKNQRLALPDNVTIFSEEVTSHYFETSKGEKIALTGFSYQEFQEPNRKIQEFPKKDPSVDWHIGLLHGEESGGPSHYAPFSKSEIEATGYDYFALGHIHQMQKVMAKPLTYYPGCIQGRHRHETGQKGYLKVNLEDYQERVEFKATAPIVFENQNLQSDLRYRSDLFEYLEDLSQEKIEADLKVLSLTLSLAEEADDSLFDPDFRQNLLEHFQGELSQGRSSIWIKDLDLKRRTKTKSLAQAYPDAFQASLDTLQAEVIQDILAPLWSKQAGLDLNKEKMERMLDQALKEIKGG